MDRGLVWWFCLVGSAICRLDFSRQNYQWNDRNNRVYSCDHNYYCECSVETSEHKILEINDTNLFIVFCFNNFKYLPLWWAKQHWIEMDIYLLASSLPNTICNYWE